MKNKIRAKEIISILLLFFGLIVSIGINQFEASIGFTSILISTATFIWTKNQKTKKTIITLNKFTLGIFLILVSISTVVLIIKTILSMVLGNLWGMMIFEYGNEVFKIIMTSFCIIGVITATINIIHSQKTK